MKYKNIINTAAAVATIALSVVVMHASAAQGLFGQWNFDETSGTTAFDSSGNGNNATLVNGPTWVAGKNGGAVQFDGIDDYVTFNGLQTSNDNTFSWTFWLNDQSSGPAIRRWLTTTNGSFNWNTISIRERVGEIEMTAGGNVITSGHTWKGGWHNYALVSDGATTKLYEDGNYLLGTNNSFTPEAGLYLGATSDTLEEFKGMIDDLRIYNYALSAADVAAVASGNAPAPVNPDFDSDGIINEIDRNSATGADESMIASNGFNDGTTFGNITRRDTWNFLVQPASAGGAIEASISGTGAASARLVTCGNSVQTSLLAAGDIADMTCGTSATTGLPTTTVKAVNAATTLSLREPPSGTPGQAIRVSLATGQSATLGSFVNSDPNNTQPITVEILDQNDNLYGTGSLAPGQSVTVDTTSPTGVSISNTGSTPVQFTVDGTVINVAPGQSVSDQCLGVAGNAGNTGCPFADKTSVTLHIVDQSKSGVCGTDSKGNPRPECTQALPGAEVKVFDRDNADLIAQFSKRPKKSDFGNLFESNVGKVGSCVTDVTGTCTAGEDHPGHFLVVVKMTDVNGNVAYDGKLKNFKNSLIKNLDQQDKDDDDADNSTADAGTVMTKKVKFEETITKTGTLKYHTLKQGETLWAMALETLGNTNTDEVKLACKQVAKDNGIGIPEWKIFGATADHDLLAGTMLDISAILKLLKK